MIITTLYLVCASKVYSGLGADIVYGIITLKVAAYLLSPLSLVTHPVIQGWGGCLHTKCRCERQSVVRAWLRQREEDFMAFNSDIGRATRWRKGQTGNAGGRPKSRLLSEALRNRLGEVRPDDPEHRTWAEAIAANLIEIAASKSSIAIDAANEVCDRAEGRPAQHLQISDFDADLRTRSDEELRFYLANNRWPSDEEKALLSPAVSAPTT